MVGGEHHVDVVGPAPLGDPGQHPAERLVDQLDLDGVAGVHLADLVGGQGGRHPVGRRLVVGHQRPVVPGPPVAGLAVEDRLPRRPGPRVAGRQRHLAPVDAAHLGLRRVPGVVGVGEAHPAEPVVVGVERVEPGDGPVGHPVGVVDPAVDGVDLDLGRAGVAAGRGAHLERPVDGRGSTCRAPRGARRTATGSSGAGPWRRGRPSPGARSPGVTRRGAWCRGRQAGSPRSAGTGRSTARSGPCRPGRSGSPSVAQDLGHRGGVLGQRHAVHEHAVGARVLAGQDGRAGRHADHRLGVGPVVADPVRGQAVDHRGAGQDAAVAGQGVVALLVGGDQEDLAAHQRAPFGRPGPGDGPGRWAVGAGYGGAGASPVRAGPRRAARAGWPRAARAAPLMTRARTAGSASTL